MHDEQCGYAVESLIELTRVLLLVPDIRRAVVVRWTAHGFVSSHPVIEFLCDDLVQCS